MVKIKKKLFSSCRMGFFLNALFHNWFIFSIIQHIILCNFFLCFSINRTNWIASKKCIFSFVIFFKCSGWAHVRGLIRLDFSRFKLNGLQFDLFLPSEEFCVAPTKRKMSKVQEQEWNIGNKMILCKCGCFGISDGNFLSRNVNARSKEFEPTNG